MFQHINWAGNKGLRDFFVQKIDYVMYFSKLKWRFDNPPKYSTVIFNFYP